MTNRFGFNLGDYNTEEIKSNDGFKDIVPEKMRNAKRWLLWRSEKDKSNSNKSRKVPYYADGTFRRGTLDTPDDLDRLVTYDVAVEVLGEKDFTGLGFALGKDGEGYWQGIDLDNIKEHKNDSLAERLPGYVEMSPSGNGVHAIGYGEYFRGKNRSGENGWE
jgi:primase-polymerase (primpol)-like protein